MDKGMDFNYTLKDKVLLINKDKAKAKAEV